ncbi:uncharacterized protein PgNI_09271 [Pyricularia grisea]|uniref:Uncharacterized protein n=1 Tax=Pyricularia grisea TaxID=148305 RepID=A0A6P8ATR3_PYRGI|nr:uncharacterized protein PgNI_09271 [Pyricularia grisea]TLD05521.1 hypothetical protein PgNI_09271 [Pyricularia grisea]
MKVDQERFSTRLFMLDTSFLQDCSDTDSTSTVSAIPLPAHLVERLEIPLGQVLDDVAMGSQKNATYERTLGWVFTAAGAHSGSWTGNSGCAPSLWMTAAARKC